MDSTQPPLRSEALATSRDELRSAGREAEDLAADLSPEQLGWRPEPDRWSIDECLEHLVRTGEAYLDVLDPVIEEARREKRFAEGPHRRTLVGRFLAWSLEPPSRLRLPAPGLILPSGSAASAGDPPPLEDPPLRSFLALRPRFEERLRRADGLDLGRIRVASPFFSFVRFDLGSSFRIIAAHERRHLWQARKVRKAGGFPD